MLVLSFSGQGTRMTVHTITEAVYPSAIACRPGGANILLSLTCFAPHRLQPTSTGTRLRAAGRNRHHQSVGIGPSEAVIRFLVERAAAGRLRG